MPVPHVTGACAAATHTLAAQEKVVVIEDPELAQVVAVGGQSAAVVHWIATQAPLLQTSSLAQGLPQAPQLF